MESRGVTVLPNYPQSSNSKRIASLWPPRQPDPVIVIITLAVLVGSLCLLSGFVLLCVLSKAWQDDTSEAILLMCIGFFVTSSACVTWKLTKAQRLAQLPETMLL